MYEECKFVWEISKNVWPVVARKRPTWVAMKDRATELESVLNTLREIKEACEKAIEFGVFKGEVMDGWNKETITKITPENISRIYFDSGYLVVYLREGRFEGHAEFLKILDDLIDYEIDQLEKHRQYMKEAEKYLRVEIVEESDEY